MKRTKLFLSILVCFLLLFATSNAQEITKEKEPARFGIGIAYGFKDRVKDGSNRHYFQHIAKRNHRQKKHRYC